MLFFILPAAICFTDLWIKSRIEDKEAEAETKELWGGRILIRRSHNTGAMLNLLKKKQRLVAGFSFGLTLCIMAGYLLLFAGKGRTLLKTGLAFLLGGACSNVYDRLTRGYVVDYFSFGVKWKKLRDVVFNIGDLFIFLGSLFVILWNLLRKS